MKTGGKMAKKISKRVVVHPGGGRAPYPVETFTGSEPKGLREDTYEPHVHARVIDNTLRYRKYHTGGPDEWEPKDVMRWRGKYKR